MTDPRIPSPLRHSLLPGLIFLVVALTALGSALALWRAANARDAARFQSESRVATVAVSERMERQIALLRGAAGLFAASSEVLARDFDAYVDRLGLSRRYPGVLGIGYSTRVWGPDGRDELTRRMRATAASDYRVWPNGTRPAYHPIVYLSPLNRRNRTAIGYDMFTEPVRRAAMIRARDTGEPAATGRVLLVQEIEAEKQPGFLVYLPVYRGGRVPLTVGARDRMLAGFVFSPIRADDLLSKVFPDDDERSIDVAVYDRAVGSDNLLYRTAAPSRDRSTFSIQSLITVAGRPWIVVTTAGPEFGAASQRSLGWWTAFLGTAAALALALAARAQARATLSAESARTELRKLNETLETRVEERTAEVTAANAGLRLEIERREGAEEQVRQMQKMEAVGQLTGGIAHDFNNMLAIVIGSLDMAKRRSDDPKRVERLIDNAMDGATRAATLTQRLLAFSRRQPLSPEVIDVNRLVAGMSELLRRTIGETVVLESTLAGGVWCTFADAGQLENAVLNLVVNARDAMPGGGSLSIQTRNRDVDAAFVERHHGLAAGEYVAIAVTDSGEGMAEETVAKAFEPFFTTKEIGKGTGLGLSQVFGFIRQSGGHVGIESKLGAGTTVTIFLPRHAGGAHGTSPVQGISAARLPRGTSDEIILVVEDEAQVRMMSVEALRDLGYTVVHAGSGPEALGLLERLPGARLLFTDVVMPGMNGRELADAAMKLSPGLKLLFTTGYTRDAVVVDGRVDEGVDLMSKPFTFEQLATKVRAVLDANRS